MEADQDQVYLPRGVQRRLPNDSTALDPSCCPVDEPGLSLLPPQQPQLSVLPQPGVAGLPEAGHGEACLGDLGGALRQLGRRAEQITLSKQGELVVVHIYSLFIYRST